MDSTFASDSYSEQSNSSDVKQHSETFGVAQRKRLTLVSHSGIIVCGKRFIYFLLFTITVGSAIAVYKYTSHDEEVDVELHTKHIASQVIEVYHLNAKKITDVCKNFAAVVASHAIGTNATWPYVTVPAFESLAVSARESIGAQNIAVTPIVTKEQREQWETYVASYGGNWIEEGFKYLEIEHAEHPLIPPYIHSSFPEYDPVNDTVEGYGIYTPVWQYSPIMGIHPFTNFDTLRMPWWEHTFQNVLEQNSGVLSDILEAGGPPDDPAMWPQSSIIFPIYGTIELSPSVDNIVATVTATLPWHSYFWNLLPSDIDPMVLVISNSCGNSLTYEIVGPNVTYIGPGDLHDPTYDYLGMTAQFNPLEMALECEYYIALYPSEEFASAEQTNNPLVYTVVVVCIFAFTVSVLMVYDIAVERRQSKVASSAERSNAIVASLFPKDVAMRLMEDTDNRETNNQHPNGGHELQSPTDLLTSSPSNYDRGARPIAELFASASVMFADLVGFTAWSSEREPSQVFELLEKIYSTFDHIAKRRGVFKVETIGDCYMAAAGLPEERADHAIILASFARDCLRKMSHVVRKLECTLGPSTGELKLRIGIHSGPVTAGVLRGEKARFQLFGDTVNTAARMESTGQPNKIQLSAQTAQLLESAESDEIWAIPREDEIEAKGKGKLHTFWLGYSSMNAPEGMQKGRGVFSDDSSSAGDIETNVIPIDSDLSRRERSIDWITQLLLSFLKCVMAMHEEDTSESNHLGGFSFSWCARPLDEVVDVIQLQSQQRSYLRDPSQVQVSEKVVAQLRLYIQEIASLYNSNHFHNFDHAIHVAMSVTKLLSRVVAPKTQSSDNTEDTLHEYTFGITSDPLAQFAVTFAALIHDVDHHGVPNATLVRERTTNARRYRNQSVAEQNSVDIAWEILSFQEFADLRACIYSSEAEFRRFRQLVVNAVMATDIADKELGAARKARWIEAFEGVETDRVVDANRKATIVIEHLIQASDVAHTMQHWHVYTRWNERFFHECYAAYLAGRAEKDPSIEWYTSEMGFFDFYVIPLAKKLKECQVFGVASDEYLNYAEANRKEWEMKGRALVEEYISKYNKSNNV